MSTDTTVSPLRQRMIEDMAARKLGPHSQRSHISSCKRFAAFLKRSPDTATADDIRRFQLHLAESGISICNRNRIMTGVKFLFRVTLRRHDLAAEVYHLKEPERLPLTVSPNEAERLLTMASSFRDQVMLSLGYGCGLRAGEIVRLKDGHIDSAQMIIRIVQSKGRKDRHVMLPPDLLVSLRQWWKVRPTRFDAGVPVGERWLFPGRRQGQPSDLTPVEPPLPCIEGSRRHYQAGQPAFASPLVRHGPARGRNRHSLHPSPSRAFEVGHDGTLYARCHGSDRDHR